MVATTAIRDRPDAVDIRKLIVGARHAVPLFFAATALAHDPGLSGVEIRADCGRLSSYVMLTKHDADLVGDSNLLQITVDGRAVARTQTRREMDSKAVAVIQPRCRPWPTVGRGRSPAGDLATEQTAEVQDALRAGVFSDCMRGRRVLAVAAHFW